MSAPDIKATEVLTEHFGFPPIALIDDIINAVNAVMYQCTESIQDYLTKLEQANKSSLVDDFDLLLNDPKKNPSSAVDLGTAKLETLLESTIDKNFDKFELYCLRNILMIPNELHTRGYFKLKHYEGITFDRDNERKSINLDLEINKVYKEISIQLYIRKVLLGQLAKVKKLVKLLKIYRDSLGFLNQSTTPVESINTILKSLSPLNESLYNLLQQSVEFFGKLDEINVIIAETEDASMKGIENSRYSKRERYLHLESMKLLKLLELVKDQGKVEMLFKNLNDIDIQNENIRVKLQGNFGLDQTTTTTTTL